MSTDVWDAAKDDPIHAQIRNDAPSLTTRDTTERARNDHNASQEEEETVKLLASNRDRARSSSSSSDIQTYGQEMGAARPHKVKSCLSDKSSECDDGDYDDKELMDEMEELDDNGDTMSSAASDYFDLGHGRMRRSRQFFKTRVYAAPHFRIHIANVCKLRLERLPYSQYHVARSS